jgi:uncharacterized protein (DUF433 family)
VAIGNLRGLGELEHLSTYTLVSDNGSVVLVKSDIAIDLVKKPGQTLLAYMRDVLAPFTNSRDIEVPALLQPRENISVDPEVRGGVPVIDGTRVSYETVAELVADGIQLNEVKDFFPAVSAAAAKDAAEFAAYVDSWRPMRQRRQTVA